MCWSVKKSEVEALLAEEKWTLDPEHSIPHHPAYVSDRGELLFVSASGKGLLYASRQELMEKSAARASEPQPQHVLEGNLPQGPHFIEAVPSLIDELARILKVPRESLDCSFDSLYLVEKALKKIRPKRRILEIPNLFPGLIAYAGEVLRKATGGEWFLTEVGGSIYEPYIRHGPGGRYMNPWLELYKSITEPGGISLHVIVSAELPHPDDLKPRVIAENEEPNDDYEFYMEYVEGPKGGAYRPAMRRRTK
ncbi:hypothetical protein [Polyangium sp. y55x31]|uniref:hypothetical protein n=1 Tax=Polyangium sp. y55x31 TaxID=3042688 RepID=UPI0024831113|nr:hypothetical protein [Polyangium sp. y55x31]MDI1482305.1 hypothetical protein [Polyangium sp. y55x31]